MMPTDPNWFNNKVEDALRTSPMVEKLLKGLIRKDKQLECIIDKQLNGYPIEEVLREVNR